MYEPKIQPPLPRKVFFERVVLHVVAASALLFVSLAIGMAGYMHFENLAWRDAFLNAAMLMGGMGPVDAPKTNDGKLFAGMYALYAGLIFIVTVGLVLTPIVHRIMHKFHWQQDR